jgi:2-dehydropantoate 2-reductase
VRFVVVGAGGVGSFVGGSLARAGHEVTLVGRGAHLRAVAERGLSVRGVRASFDVHLPATDDVARVATPDVVLLAVKAHQVAPIAERVGALANEGCTIVTMQNGVPFWFFDGFGGPLAGTRLRTVDPDGSVTGAIATGSVVGCVVNTGTRILQAGTVEQVGTVAYTFGVPNGDATSRARDIVAAFLSAGLGAVLEPNIRREVWMKVASNATLNPVSALTRATAEQMVDDGAVVAVMREAMAEQLAVGAALGLDVRMSIDERIAGNRVFGDQRTSMLQDVEAGRSLEIDAIVGAVVEIAALVGVDVPATRRLYALVRLLDRGSKGSRREV